MLSADPTRLGEQLLAVTHAGADAVHWDIMDGNYVDAITFGAHIVKHHRKLTDIPFEIHLMVTNPDAQIAAFVDAGADLIIVHPETCPHLHRSLGRIKNFGKRAGIALNPSTSPDFIDYCRDVLDMVLVMTVNPGSAGQGFLNLQLEKISIVKKKLPPEMEIAVDGGINAVSAASCRRSGANSCVTGTFLFGGNDYAAAIQSLALDFFPNKDISRMTSESKIQV
jgi:ribulose-phosphate 3-epimerase